MAGEVDDVDPLQDDVVRLHRVRRRERRPAAATAAGSAWSGPEGTLWRWDIDIAKKKRPPDLFFFNGISRHPENCIGI